MMFVLQLVLGLFIGLSSICFGMENEEKNKAIFQHNDRSELVLWANGDNIEFTDFEDKHLIKICHPANIYLLREALSSGKQFNIAFIDKDYKIPVEVREYRNGSYIWWDGWCPLIKSTSNKLVCIGTPITLAISNKSDEVIIDLGKEKEELHHHQRNKLINGGFALSILACAAYGFCNVLL